MNFTGKWKNQYGSVLEFTSQDNNLLQGTFESAVDQTTKGQKLKVTGVCHGDLLAVSCAGGNHVVTYSGMVFEGKLETVWHVVTEGKAWWQAVTTNVDTFERI